MVNGGPVLHLACQGDGSRSCTPIRYTNGNICGVYIMFLYHVIIIYIVNMS